METEQQQDQTEAAGGASAVDRRVSRLVDRFLAWPLPDSVASDQCATMPGYPHRSGTNLLTADEARQMFEYVLAEAEACARCEHEKRLGIEQQRDELLAALKELERVYETGDFDTEFKPALTKARATIAEVEGDK